MLDKKTAQEISQWTNHQSGLMKYGQFLTTPLSKEEIKKLFPERKENFWNNVLPTKQVVELRPGNPKCIFWVQVKGWYGADKSYVMVQPSNEEERNIYLAIAKKHINTIKEDVNYFNY